MPCTQKGSPPPFLSAFHGNNTNALCCFSLTGANFNKRGGGAEFVYQGRRAEEKRLVLCLEAMCIVLVFRLKVKFIAASSFYELCRYLSGAYSTEQISGSFDAPCSLRWRGVSFRKVFVMPNFCGVNPSRLFCLSKISTRSFVFFDVISRAEVCCCAAEKEGCKWVP